MGTLPLGKKKSELHNVNLKRLRTESQAAQYSILVCIPI